MKVIDLFAGAGGLSEGFRRNKFEIVAPLFITFHQSNRCNPLIRISFIVKFSFFYYHTLHTLFTFIIFYGIFI